MSGVLEHTELVHFDQCQLTARLGVALVDQFVHEHLQWIFREQPVSDVGIDAIIEQRTAGRATGRLIGAQIKSGSSWFRERTPDGWVYRGIPEHLDYWLGYELPVLLVLVDVDNKVAYWGHIEAGQVDLTSNGWKIVIPDRQRLDATACGPLSAICSRTRQPTRPIGSTLQHQAQMTTASATAPSATPGPRNPLLPAGQRMALLTLMSIGKSPASSRELQDRCGLTILKRDRDALTDLGLVDVRKSGPRLFLELTDRGWAWCAQELGEPQEPRPRNANAALSAISIGIDRYMRRNMLAPADLFADDDRRCDECGPRH
ncbi:MULTISPECIES: DUF4365 domain-containing protein [unclassified Micromonospora]|uniref:DUF4365 domain-containing protein n=1 Tax=unclassified Micromonospora TaxID=2617518 RepID=UPI001C2392B4|nr:MULTISPECIES: DUF4365 domain-containing protein [unclassified Micromonospora]MBU8857767.1 DUF4365 domain-containing protein [Micromonospora sp. WMMB482]MDM4783395.1 DUF4365 domain-containing protein [Micromonospora sp. b486]